MVTEYGEFPYYKLGVQLVCLSGTFVCLIARPNDLAKYKKFLKAFLSLPRTFNRTNFWAAAKTNFSLKFNDTNVLATKSVEF